MLKTALISALTAALVCSLFMVVRYAEASRNASGTFTLYTPGNPVVTATTISSAWANNTLADIRTEITDSLSRSGKGAMLQSLQLYDGTVNSPGLNFGTEPGTGLYRIGTNDIGFAVNQVKKLELTSSLFTVTPNVTFSGTLGIGGVAVDPLDVAVSGSASTTAATFLEASLADGNSLTEFFGKATVAGGTGILTYTKNATAANSTFCLGVFSGSASTLCVDGNNKTTIGSNGTPISSSIRGTTTWNPGTLGACGAGPCSASFTTITTTGAVAGADCIAGVADPAPLSGYPVQCIVTTNTCSIEIVNQSNVSKTFGSATFWCRVFNP